MKIAHFASDQLETLFPRLPAGAMEALVICYSAVDGASLARLCEAVSNRLPRATVIGVTSDEVIVDGAVSDQPFVVSVITFSLSRLNMLVLDRLDDRAAAGLSEWAGRQAGVLISWFAGASDRVDTFWQQVTLRLPLVGGAVGQCRGEGDLALWADGRLLETGVVVLALSGAQFQPMVQTGWQAVTRDHRVTRSQAGRIYEIDHQPALNFYHRYLDVMQLSPDQLFEVGLAFPLMVEMRPGEWVVRGVIRFFADGSLQCVGEVPNGARVQLAVGSVSRLLSTTEPKVCHRRDGALIFFCLGRKMLLGEHVKTALSAFRGCTNTGFFSFGELYMPAGRPGMLLNHTMACLTIQESAQADASALTADLRQPLPDTSDLLVNLLTRTHEEYDRIERLLTLASHVVVQFERSGQRWLLQRVMGKVELLGYGTPDLLEGRVNLFGLLDDTGQRKLMAFLEEGESARLIHTRLRQGGSHWLPVALLLLREGDQLLWLLEDLSAQQALTRIYEMFERGPVVQFEWSGEEGWPIRYVSPNVTDVLGLPYDALASGRKTFADFIHPDDLQRVSDEVAHFLGNRIVDFQQEYRIVTPQGSERWVRDYTHVVYGDHGQADTIYGFVIDITKEQEALRQLEEEKRQAAWQAMHDPLTGLYNRAYLRDIFPAQLRQARRQGWTVDLMFIDLDNFKEVNDVHGHNVGDEILRQFARRLRKLLRRSDIIARFGGDEFVVVAPIEESDPIRAADKARVLAEKILDALKEPFLVEGEAFKLGASVGIVLVDESLENSDFDTLIRYADTSMYLAKRAGRNGYRFFDEQQQKLEEARALKLTALRQAIEHGELWLAYQPQVRWREGRFELCGAEVLMRWQSEQFGFVSPGEFIPLAEDTGYILTLGNWMVETALAQLAEWRRQQVLPEGFVLSLNISAVQFYQSDFAERLCELCRRYDIPPGAVRLELTERIIYKGSDEALARMKQLREYGFSTSLDDFGTGYSSLAYLKRMDLDELKIDQTFVRNFLEDESNAVLTRTIIDLAHNFNLAPIAEGTERDEEVCALVKMGCDTFQGYFFGKPMSAADFEKWLEDSPLPRLSLQDC